MPCGTEGAPDHGCEAVPGDAAAVDTTSARDAKTDTNPSRDSTTPPDSDPVADANQTLDADSNGVEDPADSETGIGHPCAPASDCTTAKCYVSACDHVVFVTRQTWPTTAFDSVESFDTKCQITAEEADLGGDWRAIISNDAEGIDARDRLVVAGPVYNLGGERVADGKPQFWGTTEQETLANPVKYDEAQDPLSEKVWTGSDPDGTSDDDDCNGWTSTEDINAEGGRSRRVDESWINASGDDEPNCAGEAHLYCISGQNSGG